MEDNSMNNMEGLFKGADLNGAQIIVVNNGEVYYQKETSGSNLSRTEEDIKRAIEELLKEKDSQGGFVFKNKKQWWAVYRVLHEFCNYPTKMTAFVAKMNDLRLDYAENATTITYDSLSATPKDVPLMNCSTVTWDSLKDKSDNYMQQYVVANFLMSKLGIKT